MKVPHSCRNSFCPRYAVVVQVEAQMGSGMFEGLYLVYGDDDCPECGKRLEPVIPARELAQRQRSE